MGTKGGVDALSDAAIRDMVVASICVKYTQSNSVGFAKDGMMVGVGAGQQSRVERVNARVRYIEGDFTEEERTRWEAQFAAVPAPLTAAEKEEFLQGATGVTISSDAFFPFRDSIDHASKVGVSYVAQPGGSVQDPQVTACCDEYGMIMSMTGVRLFHH